MVAVGADLGAGLLGVVVSLIAAAALLGPIMADNTRQLAHLGNATSPLLGQKLMAFVREIYPDIAWTILLIALMLLAMATRFGRRRATSPAVKQIPGELVP